ncbi:hypothetical protein [Methanosarcina barkeri]|uniref:hypothetical protein n=1 Tax=Methanosarcina barkeri TaxID=2208 RepID=UPI0006D05F85|nr:hypothetical protein [Methanosarcina barkeri]
MKPDSEVADNYSLNLINCFIPKQDMNSWMKKIAKTKEKKEQLLKVLVFPEIPLHNNAVELAARAKVRKRDMSLQTITEDGTKANDTFMTIVQTAKKPGVSAYKYVIE